MDNIESLFDKTVGEIERMLNSKTVVGDPIEVGGNTLIPLVNVGFGFGVGSGEGTEEAKSSGHGGGTGGGGGVKPVALIVVNDKGVHVESVKSGAASAFEKVAETVGKAAAAKAGESAH